jgi:hypothetical protein
MTPCIIIRFIIENKPIKLFFKYYFCNYTEINLLKQVLTKYEPNYYQYCSDGSNSIILESDLLILTSYTQEYSIDFTNSLKEKLVSYIDENLNKIETLQLYS